MGTATRPGGEVRVPGLRRLQRARALARTRKTRGAFILLYHRIATPPADPFGMCVRPSLFAEQLALLCDTFDIIPLARLVADLERGQDLGGKVAITFDDGYRDNLTNGLPALEARGVPATVFVVAGALGESFWWDRLIARWPSGDADLSSRRFRRAYRRLLSLPSANKEGGVGALGHRLAGASMNAGPEPRTVDLPRAMTPEEVALLAASELIEIGGHTLTHRPLPRLAESEQLHELRECKRALEAISGRRVDGFAFPHGQIAERSGMHLRKTGYRYACSSRPDVAASAADRYALPRFAVGNWPAEELARRLRRWSPASCAHVPGQDG